MKFKKAVWKNNKNIIKNNPNIRNGGRPYGQRTIKLHTKQRTFLVEI